MKQSTEEAMTTNGGALAAQGPLAGIRVLELGTMLAGPFAATLLADFGADVIKVEQPGGGDPMRKIGPFVQGESLWWNVEGRNKRSICLDLHREEGKRVLLELVAKADVVIENFRPGTMEKWGLAYEVLRAANPRIVLLSVSGYGQTGPYAARPAYDRMAQAFSGILNMTGFPERPPVRPGVAVADYGTAVFGRFAVMMALYHRDARGGEGQHLDVAMFEAMLRITDTMVLAYDQLQQPRERAGNLNPGAAPGDHFPTADGRYIVVTVSNDALFGRLCRAMGQPELAADDRFRTHDARARRLEEINAIVGRWIAGMDAVQACRKLEEAQQPHQLILGVQEILEDPHCRARESIARVGHPKMGPIRMQGIVPRMSGTPAPPVRPAPELGQHTDEVLRELAGKTPEQIAALRAAGVS